MGQGSGSDRDDPACGMEQRIHRKYCADTAEQIKEQQSKKIRKKTLPEENSMKTGLMIRMTAMMAACIFGATTIAASPKEDPVKTEIRKSLEEGQQAIEKGTEQSSSRYQVTEVPEIIFLDETESSDAVGNNSVTDDSDVITDDSYIDDDEYDWDSDIISYEEYEREQAEAGYETPDEELFETVADEQSYEGNQNHGAMQDDEDEEDETGENQAGEITAIGDSVMLGAASAIQDEIPGIDVDAREGRQMVAAIEIAEKLNEEGKLGDTVVIALGTNGPFLQSEGQELVDAIGGTETSTGSSLMVRTTLLAGRETSMRRLKPLPLKNPM